MDPALPGYIDELAATARRAFADAGGVDLARAAEADIAERRRAADVLRALGGFDVDALADADQALAAFALCREAGRVALPYPVEATMCRVDGAPVVLADPSDPLVDHADLLDGMVAFDLAGTARAVTASSAPLGARLAPFACPVTLGRELPADGAAAAMAWTLTSTTVLGYVEAGLDFAVAHVSDRHQFGQRIADFQAVQFQIADAVVAASGLAELGLFTLWRVATVRGEAISDALALRVHAADVARSVLRTAQQLHGASGVAEEYDISVLCRRAQTGIRSPVSSERILATLVGMVREHGFASLFGHGRRRQAVGG
ncbi:MAG TPA: acyl-CoA dehydrogenase family protein [Acidimicrobiia bacterium]